MEPITTRSTTVAGLLDPDRLAPGSWVVRSQTALDQLSTMTRLDEAERCFGSARNLATEVLGPPEFGGHATKPVIKSLGRLLQHRLGPALAAETLSWLASVSDLVDSDMVKELLDLAEQREGTCRPRRLDDRFELIPRIEAEPTRAARLRLLRSWMSTRSAIDRYWFPWSYVSADLEPDDSFWARSAWIWLGDDAEHRWSPSTVFDLEDADEQIAAYLALPKWQQEVVAEDPELFGSTDELIAACLRDHPRQVILNEACPADLSFRVRHPYDQATLELALRCGEGVAHTRRLRRLLAEQPDQILRDLAARLPVDLCAAMRRCGLMHLSHFTHGPLSEVDLGDRFVVAAAFQLRPDGRGGIEGDPQTLLSVLRHPQSAARVAPAAPYAFSTFHPGPRPLPLWLARELARCGFEDLTRAAYSLVADDDLAEIDAAALALLGDERAASVPGLPGVLRPIAEPATATAFGDTGTHGLSGNFMYEPEVQRLDGARVPSCPGWSVRLFRTVDELTANARAMSNCTADYVAAMLHGHVVVLALAGPDGAVLNASLEKTGRRWITTQVNSPGNAGNAVDGIGRSLQSLTNQPLDMSVPEPWESLDVVAGHHTPRRDRRRQRATAARRKKR